MFLWVCLNKAKDILDLRWILIGTEIFEIEYIILFFLGIILKYTCVFFKLIFCSHFFVLVFVFLILASTKYYLKKKIFGLSNFNFISKFI